MHQITLRALASQKTYQLPVEEHQLQMSLMHFLQAHDLPIASSCSGKGVCKKCVVNGDQLSCSLTVRHFVENGIEVEISYL